MKFFHHLFLRILPLGLIAGFVAVLFTSGGAVQSERVEALNVNTGPGETYQSGGFDGLSSLEKSSGIEYVRETIDWSKVEPSSGSYDWNTWRPLDAIFTSEKDSGFKIVAVLDGGPIYLSNSSGQAVNTTDLLVRWANFVQAAVDQFGDRVDVWEIGSRVNSNTGLSPFLLPGSPDASTTPDTTIYSQLVKVASKIIKTADPNDEVWMGSLVSATSSSCAVNPLTFLLEMNGTKAWANIDSIQYQPERGANAPEATITPANSACASSLPTSATTLAGEIQSVTDLARQLGGKTVRIEGLGWSGSELNSLSSGRGITSDQVFADYLTRASVIALSNSKITSVFWKDDLTTGSPAATALTNLNSVLNGATFVSQPQGQSGSVYEYRFQKGSQWIIVVWHASDGDNPVPVTLAGLTVSQLMAYPVDAAAFSSANSTAISVDGSGNAIVLLNERPVVFIGTTSDVGTSVQQDVNNQLDAWKFDLHSMAHQALMDAKAALLQAMENMFTSAKDKAIQWGEDKLNGLLN